MPIHFLVSLVTLGAIKQNGVNARTFSISFIFPHNIRTSRLNPGPQAAVYDTHLFSTQTITPLLDFDLALLLLCTNNSL
jgi:hypothetical protein